MNDSTVFRNMIEANRVISGLRARLERSDADAHRLEARLAEVEVERDAERAGWERSDADAHRLEARLAEVEAEQDDLLLERSAADEQLRHWHPRALAAEARLAAVEALCAEVDPLERTAMRMSLYDFADRVSAAARGKERSR